MNKKIALPLLGVALLSAATLGIVKTSAQSNTSGQTLVQRIAQRFSLNESDVQQVFDQYHSEQKAAMQQKIDNMLTQAVKDGKITEAQKQAILAKEQELKAQFAANRDMYKTMTDTERKAAMDSQRADLEKWAKDNGIDTQYLFGLMHHGGPGGMYHETSETF